MELRYAAFRPDELALLRKVLDDAVEGIPPQFRTSEVKGRLAERILSRAAKGDRDPDHLKTAAVLDFDIRPVPSHEFPEVRRSTF